MGEQAGIWPDLERRPMTRKEIQRRYYLRHREEILAKQDKDAARARYEKFKAAHPQRVREHKAKYAAAHRVELSRKAADRLNEKRRADPEAARAADRARRIARLEHYREYGRAYEAAHPERRTAILHRRRARKMGNGAFVVIDRDWRRMLHRYRGLCAYCGGPGPFQQDHVIPIARGGRHSIGNIVPACGRCNRRKWMMTPTEWRYGVVLAHPRVTGFRRRADHSGR